MASFLTRAEKTTKSSVLSRCEIASLVANLVMTARAVATSRNQVTTLMVDPCSLPSIEDIAGAAIIRDDGSDKK